MNTNADNMKHEQDQILILEFKNIDDLKNGIQYLCRSGYNIVDIYSSCPYGIDTHSQKTTVSSLSVIGLVSAIAGVLFMLIFMIWINSKAYPINFGGKPLLSFPSFVPLLFEVAILFSVLGMCFYYPVGNKNLTSNQIPAQFNEDHYIIIIGSINILILDDLKATVFNKTK